MTGSARSQQRDEAVDLAPFKQLMLQTCGFTFENEREQALSAALSRRMALTGIDRHEAYHAQLLGDQEELLRLTELLTVNETYFFREPDHLNLLVHTLVPQLMALRSQKPVRILSAGCSTGEEPYTVAMMLRERFGSECERLFAITGVDIDPSVIAAAQKGVYGKGSFRGMDQGLLDRYFDQPEPGKFLIRDTIRKWVGFEAVNLLDGSYAQRIQPPDIILYRNVSIYFPQHIQREIFGTLAGMLAPDGYLLVGAAETMHHDIGILSLTKQNALFFFCKTPALVIEERRASNRHPLSAPARKALLQAVRPRPAVAEVPREDARTGQAHAQSRPRTGATAPTDVRERFDAAVELAHNKQHDQALAILDAIIEQDAAFIKAACLKGSLLITLTRFDEAEQVCSAVLKRDSLCLEAYLMLGIVARQKGNDGDAVKRFREAVYLNGACWPAHFFTAEILYGQKDLKRAQSSFEAALRILEAGPLKALGQAFFPLSFNAEQFMVICRHKVSLLKEGR